jgi:uncharacterized LabA/DUF88 family protein
VTILSEMSNVTARVYVDGFNFYHGAIKHFRGRRWLNFWTFAERLIPANAVLDEVHYFTTRIHRRPHDPDAPERQATYLRALDSLQGVFVHEGKFKSKHKKVVLVDPQPMNEKRGKPKDPYTPLKDLGWPRKAWAYSSEEKETDVALGGMLVADCCDDKFEVAVVVTDDTDLAWPIRFVRSRGKRVVVVSPRGYWLKELAPTVDDVRSIHDGVIEQHQLPDPLVLADGSEIAKPARWT